MVLENLPRLSILEAWACDVRSNICGFSNVTTDYPRFAGSRSRSGKEKQGETNHDTLWLGLAKGRNIVEVFDAHWSPPSMQVIL